MATGGNRSSNESPGRSAAAGPPGRSSVLVIAARAVLLMLAAIAATSAFVLTREDGRAAAGSQRVYACPMHREATSATPGECPICGMALREVAGPALTQLREVPALRQPGILDVPKRRIFSREVLAPGWLEREGIVQALVYRDEIASLLPGEKGVFRPSAAPGTRVAVHLAGGPAAWDASMSRIDFQVDGAPAPRVGTTGWLELAARARPVLVVPSTAVLQSGDGPYVLAASPDGRTFTRRPVETGSSLFGLTVVVSGVSEQERIAVRSAFFLEAEARFGAGTEAGMAVDQ
ncbi:MAG TPA: heavy metal-binding domain-containing protein [Myxococcales bacterium]|nr:heavy metal-binding domain-containing protein [Myxococcales bacterium]